jgi:hypothetical protein
MRRAAGLKETLISQPHCVQLAGSARASVPRLYSHTSPVACANMHSQNQDEKLYLTRLPAGTLLRIGRTGTACRYIAVTTRGWVSGAQH